MGYEYKRINHNRGDAMLDHYFSIRRTMLEPETVDLIIPDCTPGIMYIEKGSIKRRYAGRNYILEEGRTYLIGQKTNSTEYVYSTGELVATGVKLLPSALFGLTGISAHELTDQVVPMDEIGARPEQMAEWLAFPERGFSFKVRPVPQMLKALLDEIHRSNGLIPIFELLHSYNISYKTLQRLFKLHVGVTPKLYCRLVRFNFSVKMNFSYGSKLTDVAYQSGYFDQNHFIKEVKQFSGLPPSILFKNEDKVMESNHLTYLLQRTY